MQLSVPCYLYSISSLARYFRISIKDFSFNLIEGSIVDIAKACDGISYPGVDGIDAVVKDDDTELLFSCVDSVADILRNPFTVMNMLFDMHRGVFIDRGDCYKDLRELNLRLREGAGSLSILNMLEAAALVSCFGFKPDEQLLSVCQDFEGGTAPEPMLQRYWLSLIVGGAYPAAGLAMLKDFGIIELLWPELHSLIGLDQAKEFHPEGDVWEHSLETISHRKTNDLELSLALLLHDLGKPLSSNVDGNRFNNHAQIGRDAAASFLRRLEFPSDKIDKVCFLVENHMMPAAIKSLPTFRTEKAMLDPWFPLLLEVYRCDLMSSFNGPEGYYDACKVYRKFIKNTKNPFRGSDGKKLMRMYVD